VLRAAKPRIVAGSGAAEQYHAAAGILERDGDRRRGLHESDNTDDGRGVDAFAEGFIVEADVAAGDRGVEEAAGVGHALDRLHQLRHDLGPVRVAEALAVAGSRWQ